MSGQRYNDNDILEEKSDHDQENYSDDSDEVPTSAKERNAKDYRTINNNDLSLKISKTNTLEEDNNKRKMEDDNENGKQQKQQDTLDFTSQKHHKNKEGDKGKQQGDVRTVIVKKLKTASEKMDTTENEPVGGKEKQKTTPQKTIIYKATKENNEPLFLTNLFTGDLRNPKQRIAPKQIQPSQSNRIKTQYQPWKGQHQTTNFRDQHRLILDHNTGFYHREADLAAIRQRQHQTMLQQAGQQQQQMLQQAKQQQQKVPPQAAQQQRQVILQQTGPDVTANFRENIQDTMPRLEPRLQQQATYIINSVGEAARRITLGNSAEDNRCLKEAMGERNKKLEQFRAQQETTALTIEDESTNGTDNEAALILLSLKNGNEKHLTDTIITPKTQQSKEEKERQYVTKDIKTNDQQTNVVTATLINNATEDKSRLTTTIAAGIRIATGSANEYQTEITGMKGHSYLIHNKLLNAWLRADCIVINFRGSFHHTIFKRKTEQVKEVIKYIEKWTPETGNNKTNRIILIKDRKILDEQKSWEANNIVSEDFVYTATCSDWERNTPKQDDWIATKYKMNLSRRTPQTSATPIVTEQHKYPPNYFIFEMQGIPPEEQAKIKQSLKVSVQVLDNLPEEWAPNVTVRATEMSGES